MDREDTLQIQLPVSALGALARLLEQLQRLTGGETAGREEARGGSFDPERFRELEAASLRKAAETRLPAADAARGLVKAEPLPAETAGTAFSEPQGPASAAGRAETALGNAESVRGEASRETPVPPGGPVETEREPGEAPSVRAGENGAPLPENAGARAVPAEAGEGPEEAPAVRAEAGETDLTPPGLRTEVKESDLTAVSARAARMEPPEMAPSVDAEMGFGPGQPRGGQMLLGEEPAAAGPAPLTVQAVSLAFQRDDRRYDGGFPLYQ